MLIIQRNDRSLWLRSKHAQHYRRLGQRGDGCISQCTNGQHSFQHKSKENSIEILHYLLRGLTLFTHDNIERWKNAKIQET